jgi:hypothetical protein
MTHQVEVDAEPWSLEANCEGFCAGIEAAATDKEYAAAHTAAVTANPYNGTEYADSWIDGWENGWNDEKEEQLES